MQTLSFSASLALVLVLGACAPAAEDPSEDAGGTEDAGTTTGGGAAGGGGDAGSASDAGVGADAGGDGGVDGGVDGGAAPDAGQDGGDAGSPASSCTVANPCASVAPTGTVTFGQGGVVTLAGGSITLGQSSRAQVEALLGPGLVDDDNPWRAHYCAAGVRLQYVDADGTLSTSPSASSQDKVARVLTLAGVTASAQSPSATLGAAAPSSSPTAVVPVGSGAVRYYGPEGISLGVDGDGQVTQIGAFRAQDRDVWTLPLTLRADGQELSTLARGSSFADATAILGDDWDGTGEINLGFLRYQARVWYAAGVRIVGRCATSGCDEQTTISSFTLSPPFGGTDDGIGIGSSRAQLEAHLGETGTDEGDIVYYGTSSATGDALGVVYVKDADCVEYAAGFVFNYFNPS